MPKRTNAFQKIVHRLQLAIHDSKAIVEESAMVYNHAAKTDEEIDILVTFQSGDMTYRTAFACRDHSRKAGAAWIRDLHQQRLDCKLDRIVAVHSKGFSSHAINEADRHGVVAISLNEVEPSSAELMKAAMPLELSFVALRVFAKGQLDMTLYFPPGIPTVLPDVPISVRFGDRRCGIEAFHRHCLNTVQTWAMRECHPSSADAWPMKPSSTICRGARFDIVMHEPGLVHFESGLEIEFHACGGRCAVVIERGGVGDQSRYRYGDKEVIAGNAPALGTKAEFLIVKSAQSAVIDIRTPGGSPIATTLDVGFPVSCDCACQWIVDAPCTASVLPPTTRRRAGQLQKP